ncbi:MAG: hypothetical protein ACE5HV_10090 [Acidobacteriota bacterium]
MIRSKQTAQNGAPRRHLDPSIDRRVAQRGLHNQLSAPSGRDDLEFESHLEQLGTVDNVQKDLPDSDD